MLLSASAGTLVQLEADGPEEAAAVREIASLFSDGFGEHA
jgi:phosphotransferase system HPr-like phosphotransfer protein